MLSLFRNRRQAAPSLPPGERIYAIGDVHGRLDLLEELLRILRAESRSRGEARVTVILLGDLIDRGPDSARVVTLAMRGLCWADLRVLLGNHEAAMLQGLDGSARMLELWLNNGGTAALRSWGLELAGLGDASIAEIGDAARAAIPPVQLRWLRALPLSFRMGDYHFVHAGVRPGVPLDQQSAHDMLWIRDEFLRSRRDHGAVVVHGHTPTETVEVRPNRIGLDTGAYASGKLTAMGFEADRRWTLFT